MPRPLAPHDREPVPVAAHRGAVTELLGAGELERLALDRHVVGRRLGADVVATDDLPRFDNSAMDGYAAHPAFADQRRFPVVGDVPAGEAPDFALAPGEAARVMTGARLPLGTVGVVPVERTDAAPTGPAPAEVELLEDVVPGRHLRARGEDVTAHSLLAARGSLVTPALLALARSAGVLDVLVHRRTRVAVVATGTELAAPGVDPGAGGIHESNSEMVAALATESGCDVVRVETCPDDPSALLALLEELSADREIDGCAVDLVITTGGVSAGAFEVVRQVCEPLPTFSFVHVAMQPGGPQGLGRFGAVPVVCLPGTPVGAFVAFHVLVRPGLDARHGAPQREAGTAAYAGRTRRTRTGRVQFVTSVVADGTVRAPDARHLRALAEANCLIEVPEGVDQLIEGDVVTVHRL
ncbi:MAG: gephyrin-like molybdotransferase Glp [Terracoccus sp.]